MPKRGMRINMRVQKFISENGIEELKKGDVVEGIVKNIKPFGAFIEISDGIVGLLYIEDISIARIKTPAERLEVGQKINVVVKDIDRNLNRINFSYKEMLGSWEDNVEDLQEGSIVPGIIRETEKNKKGIFIELKPNLVGMAEYSEGFEYGEHINVYVKKINRDKKKIKLIIK